MITIQHQSGPIGLRPGGTRCDAGWRFPFPVSSYERLGFWVACIGAVMAGIGDFGEDWLQIAALGNLLYFPGMLLLLAGLALFGIGTMRARVLPLWCGAVLVLSPLVAAPLGGLFSKWGGTFLFGCIWILVGLVLWFDHSDRRS